MALLISNRGNINGINPDKENSIEYVQTALDKGFSVVVDVWLVGNESIALGTERPRFPVQLDFLKNKKIICRAMSVDTLVLLLDSSVHCFIHDRDSYVLTNGGLIWTFSGKLVTPRSIVSMPEWTTPDISSLSFMCCAGICSNYIQTIQDERDKVTTCSHNLIEEHICDCEDA